MRRCGLRIDWVSVHLESKARFSKGAADPMVGGLMRYVLLLVQMDMQ